MHGWGKAEILDRTSGGFASPQNRIHDAWDGAILGLAPLPPPGDYRPILNVALAADHYPHHDVEYRAVTFEMW